MALSEYHSPHEDDQAPLPKPAVTPRAMPFCKSEELLRGGILYIRHGSETYCLRLTKSGKLLLTK